MRTFSSGDLIVEAKSIFPAASRLSIMLGMLKLTALRMCDSLYSWEPRQSSMISSLASELLLSSDWSHSLVQHSYSVSGISKALQQIHSHTHTLSVKAFEVWVFCLLLFGFLFSFSVECNFSLTNFTTKCLHHLLLLLLLPGAHFLYFCCFYFPFVLCFSLTQTHRTHAQAHTRTQPMKLNFFTKNLFSYVLCRIFPVLFFCLSLSTYIKITFVFLVFVAWISIFTVLLLSCVFVSHFFLFLFCCRLTFTRTPARQITTGMYRCYCISVCVEVEC